MRKGVSVLIFWYNIWKRGVFILEEKEENLIKKVSKEVGLTYKELSQELGYTESSLRKSVYANKISTQLQRTIELYLETLKLKKEIKEADEFRKILRNFMDKSVK